MINEWIKDFNVIYKGELYKNCVCVHERIEIHLEKATIVKLEIMYIDENGTINIMQDYVKKFKFVRK